MAWRGERQERDSAVDEVAEFGGDMYKAVDANRALPLESDIRAGLAVIAGQLDTYTASAAALAHAAQQDPTKAEGMIGDFDKAFRALETSQDAQAQRIEARLAEVIVRATMLEELSLAMILGASLLFGALLWWALRQLNRTVIQPLDLLAGRLDTMTHGQFDIDLPPPSGNDEVAAIQKAAIAFRHAGRDRLKAEQAQAVVVAALAHGLDAIAEGDLAHRIREPFAATYEGLRSAFNRSVAETASNAREVPRTIITTHQEASEGGAVVVRAVQAMAGTERSAQEISRFETDQAGSGAAGSLLSFPAVQHRRRSRRAA